jgi:glycosyltransferase involved in cell wall biosynthesis
VIGGIGIEKGYETLLACARDAAVRRLPLFFCVVGHTLDDEALLATGCVSITGEYGEAEAISLIRAQQGQVAWLPSLWPETWSYTVTLAWRAGLDVVAYDIGVPADRIRATGRGWLLPLAAASKADVLNDTLISLRLRPAETTKPSPPDFMSRAMWFAWLLRSDVRGDASIGDVDAQRNFVPWWRKDGRIEFPKVVSSEIGAGLARPAVFGRALTEGVNLIGFARAEFGLGEDIRALSSALEEAGIPYAVLDVQPGGPARLADETLSAAFTDQLRYPVSIICASPFDTGRLYLEQGADLFAARRTVGYWPWELPRLPSAWTALYGLIDEIWAPSTFSAGAFAECPHPVLAMPPAVLPPNVRRISRRSACLPVDTFVFVYPFDPNSYLHRKNPIALVRAFREAFPESCRSVTLLLRVNGYPEGLAGWAEVLDAIGQDDRIIVRYGTLRRDKSLSLLGCCDALISPHRSEGFGRNIAEAIMLGIPVRATGFSGCMDFLRPEECISWTPRTVQSGEYPYGEGQEWAEPDQQHLIAMLRELPRLPRSDGRSRAAEFAATHNAASVGARVARRIEHLLRESRGWMRYRSGTLKTQETS